MKKKLVTALVLASLFSGVSAVYADYTDQEIDTKVNELKQADEAIRGQIGDIKGQYNRLEQAQGDLKTKDQELDGKISDEETARKAEDKKIREEFAAADQAEKKAREEKEAKLATDIEARRQALLHEIADRTGEDTKIRGEFAEADKKLDEKIDAEAKARTQLDQRLSDRLDQGHEDLEKETRERKEEDAKIREEFAKADQELDGKITAEAKARENADKELEKKLTGRDNALAGRIDKLATDTDKGLAKVSALAGLHPLDYDPANKLNLAAAGGSYNGEHAVALGAFYRPNRNVMLSFGASLAGGDNAYNVGVSVKVGKGGDRMDESNTTVSELYALVGRMQEEMMAQRNQIAEQQRKIEELQAK